MANMTLQFADQKNGIDKIRVRTILAEYYLSSYKYEKANKYLADALVLYREAFGESKNHKEYLGILRKQ